MRRGGWERKPGYGPLAKAFRLSLLRNTLGSASTAQTRESLPGRAGRLG